MNISASEFRAKCLQYLNEVAATGEPLVVARYGTPHVRVVPIEADDEPLAGYAKNTITIHGDILIPIGMPWPTEWP